MDNCELLTAPPLDAEKAGSHELIDKFQWPPDFDREISRSTLLVGTRGAGKTMFLRHRRHNARGPAVYGDLRKVLNALTNDTGAGGLTYQEIHASDEAAISTKAMALLGRWLYKELTSKGIPLERRRLIRLMPSGFDMHQQISDNDWIDLLGDELEIAPLSKFGAASKQTAFDDFLQHVSESVSTAGHRLLTLLIDRAEEVPYPSLPAVMQLLDQRHQFLAIVATRPGLLGPYHQMSPNVPIPGDHYNIMHLGSSPYGSDWRNFMARVLDAWLPRSAIQISDDEFKWLLSISRDSLRNALEILYHAIDIDGRFCEEAAIERLELIRAQQFNAAQGQLRRLNGNIQSLVHRARKSCGGQLPVAFTIRGVEPAELFQVPPHLRDMGRDELMVYLGLRTGFFTTLHGETWHPTNRIESFEIPPLYIWERGYKWSPM